MIAISFAITTKEIMGSDEMIKFTIYDLLRAKGYSEFEIENIPKNDYLSLKIWTEETFNYLVSHGDFLLYDNDEGEYFEGYLSGYYKAVKMLYERLDYFNLLLDDFDKLEEEAEEIKQKRLKKFLEHYDKE